MDRTPNRSRNHVMLTVVGVAVIGFAAMWSVQQTRTCDFIGVSDSALNAKFCAELVALGQSDPAPSSRNILGVDEDTARALAEFELLDEAYRADPKKTLELIARIREAGGLLTK